jgi:hypothetical protein
MMLWRCFELEGVVFCYSCLGFQYNVVNDNVYDLTIIVATFSMASFFLTKVIVLPIFFENIKKFYLVFFSNMSYPIHGC